MSRGLILFLFWRLIPSASAVTMPDGLGFLNLDQGITTSQPAAEYSSYLFYFNRSSTQSHVTKVTAEGKPVYSAVYSTDAYRRRLNPYNQKNSGQNQLLFFGCSFTFGQGLNDDQTIPAQVSLLTHKTRAFNYGTMGYSPGHVLSYLRYVDISRQFTDRANTSLIYLWGDHLFERVSGSFFHLSWGGQVTPYYYTASDGLKFGGTLSDHYPVRALLAHQLLRLPLVGRWLMGALSRGAAQGPPSKYEIDLSVQILRDAFEEYKRQFKSDRFYVVFYPGSQISRDALQENLRRVGISTIDLVDLFLGQKDPNAFFIPDDGHPSARAAREVAQGIIKALALR